MLWYPWGPKAIELARVQNKPILLSIGYSTCYWCHVMEREVFENVSIAQLMNQHFINIKVDREEYPELDEIYMVARQVMTHEGGWPNNVFLTPDLKPFFAGGTFPAADTQGKASFPRLLEWLNYAWQTQAGDVRRTAEEVMDAMQRFLVFAPAEKKEAKDSRALAAQLFLDMKKHHDAQSGGFFQAPKFPHEHYLKFLLSYHERTGETQALDMALLSLRKMAGGGIYDHVGCGFHRYAVDKEWYVPHFEKMLYNQAMLARLYTDAARITGNPWLTDIARSILEFVRGPLTDAGGAFYSALDAETDGVEGEYYAWAAGELQQLLTPEETAFLTTFYALADIPQFPGHKHTQGQALIARRPLDEAAAAQGMPYAQLAAMAGQLMNKLLAARNVRKAPRLDDKIIVGWNGLMIDAFAHAGKTFARPEYVETAASAAGFLLEHLIDKDGRLCRAFADGRAGIPATLEDYACLIKGLLSLHAANNAPQWLEAAVSLAAHADELFFDAAHPGYFFTELSEYLPLRIKSPDDSTLPNANAIMIENLNALHAATGDASYRERAEAMRDFFLGQERMLLEMTGMVTAAMGMEPRTAAGVPATPAKEAAKQEDISENIVSVVAALSGSELTVTLNIKGGWHINAHRVLHSALIPTQVDVQGEGVMVEEMLYPDPVKKADALLYEGVINITARLQLLPPQAGGDKKNRTPLTVRVRFQPCRDGVCRAVTDLSLTI